MKHCEMPGQGQGGLCRRCNRPTSKHKQARWSQEHKLQRGTQYNTAHNITQHTTSTKHTKYIKYTTGAQTSKEVSRARAQVAGKHTT